MSRSKPLSVPREFAENFEVVAEHFRLREMGEYDLAKRLAREDLDNAVPCYAALAGDIRRMEVEL